MSTMQHKPQDHRLREAWVIQDGPFTTFTFDINEKAALLACLRDIINRNEPGLVTIACNPPQGSKR